MVEPSSLLSTHIMEVDDKDTSGPSQGHRRARARSLSSGGGMMAMPAAEQQPQIEASHVSLSTQENDVSAADHRLVRGRRRLRQPTARGIPAHLARNGQAAEGACTTAGLLKAMHDYFYQRTAELEGPIPVEEVGLLSQICNLPLPSGMAVRRKRSDDAEPASSDEVRRLCTTQPQS